MSRTTLAGVAGVETAPADRAGFFSRLYAAITKSRRCSADRHVARHQHLLDRLAGRIEPAGTGGRPGVVATSRTRAEDDVAARYVGDRWCDTTERKQNDELMAGGTPRVVHALNAAAPMVAAMGDQPALIHRLGRQVMA